MKKKSQSEDISLFQRALKIAAIEAYHSEIEEYNDYKNNTGTGKQYNSVEDIFKETIERWLHEAEIKTNPKQN